MAIRFDASGDYLSRSSDVLDYNGAYTWMGWINLQVDANALTSVFIIDDGTASNRDWLRFDSSGTGLEVRVDTGGAGSASSATTLTVGTWYHVALVRESATVCKFYVDGSSIATNTTSNAGRAAASRMNTATRNAGTNPFNGRVAYCKVWSVALSAAEVAAEMRAVRPLHQLNNLYAWWPMRPGSGERTRDYSGRGRGWTEAGTLTDEQEPPVSWGAPSQPVSVVSGAQVAFALNVASLATTPDTAAVAVARALVLGVASESSTPDPMLSRALAYALNVASQSSTPDTATLVAIVLLALNVASTSSTPDAALAVARALGLGVASTSSTPDVALAVARALALAVVSGSETPDVVVLTRIFALALNVASQSSTPDGALTLLMPFVLAVVSTSSTPAAALAVARAFALAAASLSATPDTPELGVPVLPVFGGRISGPGLYAVISGPGLYGRARGADTSGILAGPGTHGRIRGPDDTAIVTE